jgi:hypothetical protein
MRIRSTKPEFWRSERIARVSWDARLVLKGLESFVDDNGVGRDDLALIVGDLFQRDLVREPSRTLARVSESISELNNAGLVHRYRAQDTDLLFLSFWESVQRVDKPQPGRFPRPDGTLHYKESLIREPDASIREDSRALAPGTEEQGNRGTEEQVDMSTDGGRVDAPRSIYSDSFLEWWQVYPRKESKGDAWKAWEQLRKAKQLPAVDDLKAAAKSYAARGSEPQFLKLPGGWLRDRKWEDEAVKQASKTPSEFDWMNA